MLKILPSIHNDPHDQTFTTHSVVEVFLLKIIEIKEEDKPHTDFPFRGETCANFFSLPFFSCLHTCLFRTKTWKTYIPLG
jgi:hypothetical protein